MDASPISSDTYNYWQHVSLYMHTTCTSLPNSNELVSVQRNVRTIWDTPWHSHYYV